MHFRLPIAHQYCPYIRKYITIIVEISDLPYFQLYFFLTSIKSKLVSNFKVGYAFFKKSMMESVRVFELTDFYSAFCYRFLAQEDWKCTCEANEAYTDLNCSKSQSHIFLASARIKWVIATLSKAVPSTLLFISIPLCSHSPHTLLPLLCSYQWLFYLFHQK